MVVKQLTREEIELQINKDMDEDLVALLQASASDRPKLLQEFEKKRMETITAKIKTVKETEDKARDGEKKATDAFRSHTEDVVFEALAKITDAFNALEYVTGISVSMRKDATTLNAEKPTLILAGLKTVKTGSTSDRSARGKGLSGTTKDGTAFDYPSAAAAKVALLEGKESAQMSRDAVVSALKTAGHIVND